MRRFSRSNSGRRRPGNSDEEIRMSDPKVAATRPAVIELEAGKYYWCQCGRSEKQPFCDGSHAGTDLGPLKVELSEKKRVALCQCKHTANPPFCDGTHSGLE
jgi:CDGSH-type Zn-finger protein